MSAPLYPFHLDHILNQLGKQTFRARTLYLVSLPIGNLADITLRALHVLSLVDCIAAEDTRHTKPLLDLYKISTHKLISLHQHNEREKVDDVIALLEQDKRVALVSDAGTPAISDPGAKLVRSVQARGFEVCPVVGASALTAAISLAGLKNIDHKGVSFIGFLPQKQGELNTVLAYWALHQSPMVCFESPHRIVKTLKLLATHLPGWEIVISRELTKQFEEVRRLPVSDCVSWAEQHSHLQGEFVLCLIPPTPAHSSAQAGDENAQMPSQLQVETHRLILQLKAHLPDSKVASILAQLGDQSKSDWYDYLQQNKSFGAE
jgi:16S rRNA (cytidine1402-2'-O)-methyltransferase